MNAPRPRLARVLALASLLWVAGCADSITLPDEVLVLDDEMTLFMAEASGAATATSTASPAERAAAAVAHAKSVLERVIAALATHPGRTAEVRALLGEAAAACARAEAFLANGNLQFTVRAAMTCANQAREAVFLARTEHQSQLLDRATAAVSEARRLLEAATAVLDADSPEQAHAVLARARDELALAELALEARRLGEALGRANRASVVAERILRVFG
jgi:hypothetical protein